ncbi:MAG: cytochrome c-type biogenesis protein [Xanthomonadales bacterium]|nr:cytochrome c-type biogenesis protein [Xanthomonadales bacterium]
MKRLILIIMLGLVALPTAAVELIEFDSPEQEQRFRELATELRCLVCQNQSLADSDAGLAKDLRDEVLRLMREGLSDEEIKTYLAARYGDFVLYRPPVKPATWALWFGPFVLLLIAVAALLYTIRRRSTAEELVADPDQKELDRRIEEEQP